MRFLTISSGHVTRWKGTPERVHQFDEQSISAVNAASAAQRPLLVRGEPGVGKTQLAEAAAIELQRAFVRFTVDARTESRDLLWRFDAVQRLAQAQLYAASKKSWKEVEPELAERNFVRPGPLWWAFYAETAKKANRGAMPLDDPENAARASNGWVVLIDEIDKAESDVPNGLLEALGSGQFTPFGYEEPIRITGEPPLIILTTNEERTLPNAFLRRCLVLELRLPAKDEDLVTYLVARGRAHFSQLTTDEVLLEAARQLASDRKAANEQGHNPKPGQAEYLDLIRAVIELAEGDISKHSALIGKVAHFALKKHLGAT